MDINPLSIGSDLLVVTIDQINWLVELN